MSLLERGLVEARGRVDWPDSLAGRDELAADLNLSGRVSAQHLTQQLELAGSHLPVDPAAALLADDESGVGERAAGARA